jgi:adenylate cyclase
VKLGLPAGLFSMRFLPSQTSLLAIAGVIVVALAGWACLAMPFADPLARLSYDLPFAPRANLATPEVCLVLIDEKAARALDQPLDAAWDRRLHAKLVRTLTEAGARAVLFDVVFDTPSADPAADAEFAAALAASGRIYLGAALRTAPGRSLVEEQIFAPTPILRRAAAGWGLLVFRPVDPDFGVRQIFPGSEEVPSASWRVAHALGAPIPAEPDLAARTRWLNYYSPPGTIPSVSYHEALRPTELAPNIFRDRIVVIGGRMTLGSLSQQKDEFFTPYTRWGRPFAPGVEIHATALLNLLRGDWLVRMSPRAELWLAIVGGALISVVLTTICAFCPFRSAAAAVLIALLIAAAACWSAWHQRVWFDWLVLAAVQTPLALFWALGTNYLLEARRRGAIRRAFALYLSPHMADEIANSRMDLKPGGQLVEATMMFTDLQGFTSLSEQLQDPRQISDVLVTYFNNTTQHVLDNRGTIIKYVGDAVYATWGAPLPDAEHAYHAVLAAWGMHQYSQLNVHGHHLVTRIGVNTGTVLAGNLGSNFRFDYTLIGDATNLAARLEGLNKYLGTQVLLTEFTWQRVKDRFAARALGKFRVIGKKEPVVIYELLGPTVTNFVQATMEIFARALAAFQDGDLAQARTLFEQTRTQRGGTDGPSEFYLHEIERLEKSGLPADWDGVIELSGK